jgi:hypothetical protein
MKIFFSLSILLLILNCSSSEYRLIGITSKLQEVFYYGKDFSVSAWKVDDERLDKIRLEIKNSIAVAKIENPREKWKEITELSTKDGEYVLFQIYPESRVPAEFLAFQFKLNDTQPIKSYSYYNEVIETNLRNMPFYSGPFHMGGIYGDQKGFIYPIPRQMNGEISQKLVHIYNFLILFPETKSESKKLFRVITPNGNYIDFEINNL